MSAISIPVSNNARNVILDLTANYGPRTRRGRLYTILTEAESRNVGSGSSWPIELKSDLVTELEKVFVEAKGGAIELSAVEREAIRLLRIKIAERQRLQLQDA